MAVEQGSQMIVGGNFYNPDRWGHHQEFYGVCSDPQGIDWTARANEQCYRPIAAETNALSHISFDFYGITRAQINKYDRETGQAIAEALRTNGIGDTYIHALLPDLSFADKTIVIRAGLLDYERTTGGRPKWFWGPESALDNETLMILADCGYKGVVCAPEQVRQADGSRSDNKPTRLILPNRGSILALPFDRELANDVAFKPKDNADIFTRDHIIPAYGRVSHNVLVAFTDGETFGHHGRDQGKEYHKFLAYLVEHALQDQGITPVNINELSLPSDLPQGQLNERTAWSCLHGDLKRWHGQCQCSTDHRQWVDTRWKEPFYQTFALVNGQVDAIVRANLGPDCDQLMIEHFPRALENRGGTDSTPLLSLLSAKASSLTARTSCATYFDSPGTSGAINILFALQAIQHLRDAGIVRDAARVEQDLITNLEQIQDPYYPQNGRDMVNGLLSARQCETVAA